MKAEGVVSRFDRYERALLALSGANIAASVGLVVVGPWSTALPVLVVGLFGIRWALARSADRRFR